MNSEKRVRIIIVDDHALFRSGLRATFSSDSSNIEIAGEADRGETLFGVLATTEADLVLLDINLPDMSGVDIARRLHCNYPNMKILAVSAEIDPKTVEAMLDAGINGFISKQKSNASELAEAINTVMDGQEYFGKDISSLLYNVYVAKKKTIEITSEFTEREREIIYLCSEGLIYKEVANRLGISTHTVNTHKKNIFQKLGINNTVEMVRYAMKNGIIQICVLILICFFFISNSLQAQDRQWTQSQIDSLEKILNKPNASDDEIYTSCKRLMEAYAYKAPRKSLEYSWKGAHLAKKKNQNFTLAEFYYNIGISHYLLKQMDSSLYYYELSRDMLKQVNDKEQIDPNDIEFLDLELLIGIGTKHHYDGKFNLAVEYWLKALSIAEKLGELNVAGTICNNIAESYSSVSNYQQTEFYFLKAEKYYREADNIIDLAEIYSGLSQVYLIKNDCSKALKYAEESYNITSSLPDLDISFLVESILSLSRVWLQMDDPNKALKYAQLAFKYSQQTNFIDPNTNALNMLSKCYMKLKRYKEAEDASLQALALDSTDLRFNIIIYEDVARANIWMKNSEKAIYYFDKLLEASEEYSNQHFQSSLSEMEVKYETAKKELEIEEQKSVIKNKTLQSNLFAGGVVLSAIILALFLYLLRLRKRNNLILTEMNATKDKFFSIISHDLKNPAVAQRDAIRQLVMNAHLWNKDELADYCNDLLKSADAELELLYSLLGWAQIQTKKISFTPVTFDLPVVLRTDLSLIRKMAEAKNITFTEQTPKHASVTGDINMLVTVVRNLLTNAVKFTHVEGEIALTIEPTSNGKHAVAVSDTGIGMTPEEVNNLFSMEKLTSTKGTMGEGGTSLGLIVCKELLKKHESTLFVESEAGKGSKFWFEI